MREHPVVTASRPPGKQPPEDDTALLITAMNAAQARYDAEIDRGLQVLNYFFVATAILATAYVSAINGKHYAIAAVLALAGMSLNVVTFLIGMRQREAAYPAALEVRELHGRIAGRLKLESAHVPRFEPGQPASPPGRPGRVRAEDGDRYRRADIRGNPLRGQRHPCGG